MQNIIQKAPEGNDERSPQIFHSDSRKNVGLPKVELYCLFISFIIS